MEQNLEKLRKNMKLKKEKVDFLITQNGKADKIHMKSIELDHAIALYLKVASNNKKENEKLLAKYKKLIDKDYKEEIIQMIEKDVKDKFTKLTKDELNHFCNNVYYMCSLKANKIEEQEIIKQIMYRNNIFLYEMQQKGKIVNNEMLNVELKFFTKLKNKYVKIIKERI